MNAVLCLADKAISTDLPIVIVFTVKNVRYEIVPWMIRRMQEQGIWWLNLHPISTSYCHRIWSHQSKITGLIQIEAKTIEAKEGKEEGAKQRISMILLWYHVEISHGRWLKVKERRRNRREEFRCILLFKIGQVQRVYTPAVFPAKITNIQTL